MNLLVVGVSHRTAGVPLLERLAVPSGGTPQLLTELLGRDHVGEAIALSTCNRVEIYAAVTAFHGGLSDIGEVLARRVGAPVTTLAPHLYVNYDTVAVRHAFRVAAGLDSMVVGEAQILGQLREAYGIATEHGAAGRLLHELMQQALRVGKRVHAETGIDRAGQSVVTAALDHGLSRIGAELTGRTALVIGAGSMGGLALATLRRAGAGRLMVANRGVDRAIRLGSSYGAEVVPFGELATALGEADVVITATASPEPVLTADLLSAARPTPRRGELLILDLAVPRDVTAEVAGMPGVTVVDLERLGAHTGRPAGVDMDAAEQLVAAEVEVFRGWLRGSDVAPTVAALRARADDLVEVELGRLAQRRPELTDEQRADVAQAVHRVVQRLLHQPTVRVRQLATAPGGEAYAEALRELFDLRIPTELDGSAVEP